jgi:hypothetical protein
VHQQQDACRFLLHLKREEGDVLDTDIPARAGHIDFVRKFAADLCRICPLGALGRFPAPR